MAKYFFIRHAIRLLTFLCFLLIHSLALAISPTWTAAVDTNWNNASNWTNPPLIPGLPPATAADDAGFAQGAPRTIQLMLMLH